MQADGGTSPGSTSTTLVYQPALDGVRALSVVAVLLFHGGVPGFSGGYLGVSVFFTLSGFLITLLLVTENDRSGDVDLRRFYGRRARRLLPASVFVVLAVVLLAALTDWFDGVTQLRSHAIGSLLQISNWVFLAGGGSYQELLERSAGTASPLEHYWSLSIEEQFYWIWPVAFVVLSRRARSATGRLRTVAGITLAFAVSAPVIAAVWGPDAAYWATPARAAEIMVGALLALVVVHRRVPNRLSLLAPVGLVALGVMVVLFPAAGGPAYSGALPLVAVASGALLLGLQAPGPFRRVLALEPLPWLGRISYGVYLYHWPIYVVANEERTGLEGPTLLALRLLLTLVIAQASYLVLEQPIRRASSLTFRPTMTAAAGATVGAVILAIVLVPGAGADYWAVDSDVADAAAIELDDAPLVELAASTAVATTTSSTIPPPVTTAAVSDSAPLTSTTSPTTTTTIPPIPELGRPVRIVVAGDSTAEATGFGVVGWAASNSGLAQAEIVTERGCGFLRGGDYLVGDWERKPTRCERYLDEELPDRVEAAQADVVVMITTSWDVLDHRWPDGPDGATTDPAVAERVRRDFLSITDELLARGAGAVAWVRMPIPDPLWFGAVQTQEEPERHEVLRDVMADVAAERPGAVHVIDLAGHVTAAGLDDDEDVRPDGVHFTPESSIAVASTYLGEQIIRAALDLAPR